jgi:hypothetical protein
MQIHELKSSGRMEVSLEQACVDRQSKQKPRVNHTGFGTDVTESEAV